MKSHELGAAYEAKTSKAKLEDLYRTDQVKALKKALARTWDMRPGERMEAISNLIGGYGVEAIRGNWQNGYWCDIVANYVNVGDTYNLTVMHVRGDSQAGRFIVSSWGDWVEKNGEKYGVQ